MRKKLMLGGLVIIIVAIAALATIFGLKSKTNKTAGNTSASANTQAPAKAGSPYILSDLGVKLPSVPAALTGMTATAQKSPAGVTPPVTVVQLHLQSYSDLANKCLGTPLGTTQSFANISTASTLNGSLPPGAKSLKQFKNFYITELGASIPSDINCQDKTTQQKLSNLNSQLNQALMQALNQAQAL